MRDYRENQSRRDWWNEKVWWFGGMRRNDIVMVIVGILIAALYFKFPIQWDWVFGLRVK